jgi:hypothetical protein
MTMAAKARQKRAALISGVAFVATWGSVDKVHYAIGLCEGWGIFWATKKRLQSAYRPIGHYQQFIRGKKPPTRFFQIR